MTWSFGLYSCRWFVPKEIIGESGEIVVMTTFLAPPRRCLSAFSFILNILEDSKTIETPLSPHGISAGSRLEIPI